MNEFCGNRLPCGLCMIMRSPCPYAANTIEVMCGTQVYDAATDVGRGYKIDVSSLEKEDGHDEP